MVGIPKSPSSNINYSAIVQYVRLRRNVISVLAIDICGYHYSIIGVRRYTEPGQTVYWESDTKLELDSSVRHDDDDEKVVDNFGARSQFDGNTNLSFDRTMVNDYRKPCTGIRCDE